MWMTKVGTMTFKSLYGREREREREHKVHRNVIL